MKRKIIKQSGRAYTITLPINWIRENNIEEGDEIELNENNNQLNIVTENTNTPKTSISLDIPKGKESSIRTLLINTYRSGFDVINVNFEGDSKELIKIVDTFMIGFELFEKSKNKYIIESVSEPNYDNFDNMINRIFYSIEYLIQINPDLSKIDISDNVHKIQKYDNFLKRCISKKKYSINGNQFLWQFLSNLTQISRVIYHFSSDLKKFKISDMNKEEQYFNIIKEMIEILKISYLKKSNINLKKLHELDEELNNKIKNEIKEINPIVAHHILLIGRIIYLTGSPLTGYFHANSFSDF